jgi:cysteine desulfurase
MLYFDHNATTPLLPVARQVWQDATERFIGNPSSPHRIGARADRALNEAREQLAQFLGCHPLDLVWTSGATEACNTVLHHFARTLPAGARVWVSAIEHPCVLEPARRHFGAGRVQLLPVTPEGVLDLEWFSRQLRRQRPGLVAVMAANNETGVLQPWREVNDLCRAHGVPFFCDAAQWIGKLPAAGLGGCDFVSGAAHKFGGPRGVGFLKCPAAGVIEPLLLGGPQEEGRRAGTENVAGVLAMLAALEFREAQLARGEAQEREAWRDEWVRQLPRALPGAVVVGASRPRLWNTVSALMPETPVCQRWVVKLDKLGLAVSTGSACASGKEAPSHVLSAMGLTPDQAARALRFSAGWETTRAEWEQLLDALKNVHAGMSASMINP